MDMLNELFSLFDGLVEKVRFPARCICVNDIGSVDLNCVVRAVQSGDDWRRIHGGLGLACA